MKSAATRRSGTARAVKILVSLGTLLGGVLGPSLAFATPPATLNEALDCEALLGGTFNLSGLMRRNYIFLDDLGKIKSMAPPPKSATGLEGQIVQALRSVFYVSKMSVQLDHDRLLVFRAPKLQPKVFSLHNPEGVQEFLAYANYFDILMKSKAFEKLGLRLDPESLEVRGSLIGSPSAQALEVYRRHLGVKFSVDFELTGQELRKEAAGAALLRQNLIWLSPQAIAKMNHDEFQRLLRHETEHILSFQTRDHLRLIEFEFPGQAQDRQNKWGLYAARYGADEIEARIAEIALFLKDATQFSKISQIDDTIYMTENFIREQREVLEVLERELQAGFMRPPGRLHEDLVLYGFLNDRPFTVYLPLEARSGFEREESMDIDLLDRRELAFALRMVKARLVRIEAQARLMDKLLHDPSGSWSRRVNARALGQPEQLELFEESTHFAP